MIIRIASFAPTARAVCAIAVGSLFAGVTLAQSDNLAGTNVTNAAAAKAHRASPYRQQVLGGKAKEYYSAAWGVDKLKVSYTSSGNLIRFSYRVANPERAGMLSDKKATPYMLGVRSHALLQIPVMDKVGVLRQTAAPQAGQEYWMTFSNKGGFVKPGDRVNVTIGAFHADGLVVE